MQFNENLLCKIETMSIRGFVRYVENSTWCLMQSGFYCGISTCGFMQTRLYCGNSTCSLMQTELYCGNSTCGLDADRALVLKFYFWPYADWALLWKFHMWTHADRAVPSVKILLVALCRLGLIVDNYWWNSDLPDRSPTSNFEIICETLYWIHW
jgi:hypothetical protein